MNGDPYFTKWDGEDEPAHDFLTSELYKEAEAHHDTRVMLEDEKVKVQRLDEAVVQLREQRDEARATKDMHKERADYLEGELAKAEAEVRRLKDELQNSNEAWAALSDDYEELRAAPQLPAGLPVVESVELLRDDDVSRVVFTDGNVVHIDSVLALYGIPAGLAVLAAEAAKTDPVEELARVMAEADGSVWADLDNYVRNTYLTLAGIAIAWTEKRDA